MMDVENMHEILEILTAKVKTEVSDNMKNIDACEMSHVTDMIKDVSQAMYYRKMCENMCCSGTEDTIIEVK